MSNHVLKGLIVLGLLNIPAAVSQPEECRSVDIHLTPILERALSPSECTEGVFSVTSCSTASIGNIINNCANENRRILFVCSTPDDCLQDFKDSRQNTRCSVYQDYFFQCNDGPCNSVATARGSLVAEFSTQCDEMKVLMTFCKLCSSRHHAFNATCSEPDKCLEGFVTGGVSDECNRYQALAILCKASCLPVAQARNVISRTLDQCQTVLATVHSCATSEENNCAGRKTFTSRLCSTPEQCLGDFGFIGPTASVPIMHCNRYRDVSVSCFDSGTDECPSLGTARKWLDDLFETCPLVAVIIEPCPSAADVCQSESITVSKKCVSTDDCLRDFGKVNNQGVMIPCTKYGRISASCHECGKTEDALDELEAQLDTCDFVDVEITSCATESAGNPCYQQSVSVRKMCSPLDTAENCLSTFNGGSGPLCMHYQDLKIDCLSSRCNDTQYLIALVEQTFEDGCPEVNLMVQSCSEPLSNCKNTFLQGDPYQVTQCKSVEDCFSGFVDENESLCTTFSVYQLTCHSGSGTVTPAASLSLDFQTTLFIGIGGAAVAILLLVIVITGVRYRQRKRVLSKVVPYNRNGTATSTSFSPYSTDPCGSLHKPEAADVPMFSLGYPSSTNTPPDNNQGEVRF